MAEDSRKKGEHIPGNLKKTKQGLFYTENFIYTQKIKNYFDTFGKHNVKVVIFDDLVNNKNQMLNEVLDFLSLENNIDLDLVKDVYNKSIKYRNYTLNKIIKFIPRSLKSRYSNVYRKNIDEKLNRIIKKDIIVDCFIPEIESLEILLERNFENWKKCFN